MNTTRTGASKGAGFVKRYLPNILGALLALLLGAMLLATIYFTLFDLQWVAFLLGVLFMGGAALVSQSAKAQWLVVRRTAQLKRARELLAEQSLRTERSNEALKSGEARFRTVCDTLSTGILFVDRSETCRYHNPAFGQWSKLDRNRIDGMALREVVGAAIYQDIQSHEAEVLQGKEARYDASWPRPGAAIQNMKITMLPFPPDAERPTGFYVLADSSPKPAAPQDDQGLEPIGREPPPSRARVETTRRESATPELTADDARADLLRALEQDAFILFAQKIVPVSAGASQSHFQEILLRLQEKDQHLLAPEGFLGVAERYNLMGHIDRWVVRNLLEWCAAKRREDSAWHCPLSCVNLSRAALMDSGFASYVQEELARAGIPGDMLCFEISAANIDEHTAGARRLMESLKALGCHFSVDGFEGGQGSYARLRELAFDFLKIDGFTILNMLVDEAELATIKAIVLTCRHMGLQTVAQFVETREIRDKLVEVGVDYVQGFGVGNPGPLAEIH
ncbi:MAG TPA: EAL domain-containing protein [Burkholderiales bacterium]|nr:EAL domain-containing protein [Burkholderiales bacterium]